MCSFCSLKTTGFRFNLYCSPAVYSFVLLKRCAIFAFCVCLNTSICVSIAVFLIGFIATCIHWCLCTVSSQGHFSSTVIRILQLYVCLSCYMANVIYVYVAYYCYRCVLSKRTCVICSIYGVLLGLQQVHCVCVRSVDYLSIVQFGL